MDLDEDADNYRICMDIPGADKENITVRIDDRNLNESGRIFILPLPPACLYYIHTIFGPSAGPSKKWYYLEGRTGLCLCG
jgi:hypothetical protein